MKALIKTAEQNGYTMRVLSAVEEVNGRQKSILFEKLMKHFNGDLKGKTIALWGLAFKPVARYVHTIRQQCRNANAGLGIAFIMLVICTMRCLMLML